MPSVARIASLGAVAILSLVPRAVGAEVDERGAYTQRITIAVPPFHGIEPHLALVYDSQVRHGIAGSGWQLEGGSAILRTGPNGGAPTFTAEDQLVLDGFELIPCAATPASPSCMTGGTHAMRVDDFRRIQQNSDNTWTIWDRDGTRRTYQAIYSLDGWPRWLMTSVLDTHANVVTYAYDCVANDRECYLSSIAYGEGKSCGPGEDGDFPPEAVMPGTTVDFVYEPRADALSYATGTELAQVGQRLRRVEVKFQNTQVRAYAIDYETSLQGGASLAARIRVEGAADPTLAAGDAPTYAFQMASEAAWTPWQEQAPLALGESALPLNDLDPHAYDQDSALLYDIMDNDGADNPWFAADLDGDGRTDALGLFPSAGQTVQLRAAIARPGGGFDVTTQDTTWDFTKAWDNTRWLRYHVGDIDGDHRTDIVVIRNSGAEGFYVTTHAALSNGDGTFRIMSDQHPPVVGWDFRSPERRARTRWLSGDVDGDGRTDMVVIEPRSECTVESAQRCGCTPNANPEQFCEHAAITAGISQGDGSYDWHTNHTPWTFREADDPHWHVGDHDGDGRADVIRVEALSPDADTPSMHAQLAVAQSNGDGSFALQTAQDTGVAYVSPVLVLPSGRRLRAGLDRTLAGDFNGDGRADVIMLGEYGTSGPYNRLVINTALSTGVEGKFELRESFSNLSALQLNSAHPARPRQNFNKWMVADLDGDGASDLVVTSHDQWSMYQPNRNQYPVLVGGVEITRLISDHRGGFLSQGARTRRDWELTCYELDGGRDNCEGDTYFDLLPGDVNADGRDDLTYIGRNWTTGTLRFSADLAPRPIAIPAHDHWRPTDVDGDGRLDLVAIQAANPGFMVSTRLQRGSDPVELEPEATELLTEVELPPEADQASWRVGDIGSASGGPDGRADLVLIESRPDGEQRLHAYLGAGDATWQSGGPPIAVATLPPGERGTWRSMDVNGDGASDLVVLWRGPVGFVVVTAVADGKGAFAISAPVDVFATPPPSAPSPGDPGLLSSAARIAVDAWRVLDLNADGRDDLIHLDYQSTGSVARTLIATDHGFRAREYPLGTTPPDLRYYVPGDLNGDGSADLVYVELLASPQRLAVRGLVSKGNGNFAAVSWPAQPVNPGAIDRRAPLVTDLDGDGRSDLVLTTEVNGRTRFVTMWNQVARWQAFDQTLPATTGGRSGQWMRFEITDDRTELASASRGGLDVVAASIPRDEMVVAWNGSGARAAIAYRSSEGAHAVMPIGSSLRVVDRLTHTDTTDPTAPASTEEFLRGGAIYSYLHHRPLGFETIEIRDGRGKTFEMFELGDACGARSRATERQDLAGKRLAHHAVDYTAPGVGAAVCLVANTYDRECDGAASCRITSESFAYDAYGNLVRHVEHGDATTLDDDRRVDQPPVPNPTAYIVDRPAYTNVSAFENGAWTVVASTLHVYDANADHTVPPTRGDLRESRAWDDVAATYRVTRTEYQGNGLPSKTFEPPTPASPTGVWNETRYDCGYKRFPVAQCTAVGCTEIEWDKALEVPTRVTDLAGSTTTVDYDTLGRPATVADQGGGVREVMFPTAGQIGTAAQKVRTTIADGTPDGLWTDVTIDGYDRVTRLAGESGDAQSIAYLGDQPQIARVTSSFADATPALVRTFTYDAMGRTADGVVAPGTPSAGYARRDPFVGGWADIDAAGNERAYFTDGHGRVVAVRDKFRNCEGWDAEGTQPIDCGGTYSFTRYGYDALDNLTDIVDDAGNVTHLERDSLGRVREHCDPDAGCWQFDYYADGRLASRTDADGRRVAFDYDQAGRQILTRYAPPGQSAFDRAIETTYDVDPATGVPAVNGRGRVTRVVDKRLGGGPTVTDTYAYDAMGRVDRQSRCVDSDCVEIGFSYDIAGRLAEIVYPDASGRLSAASEHVAYGYDAAGRVESMGGYVSHVRYAGGRIETLEYENGVTAQFTRNPDRGWLEHIQVTNTKGELLSLGYQFDRGGRVRQHSAHNLSPIDWTYGYDALDRLTTVRASDAAHDQELTYKPTGQIKGNSAVGDYLYDDPSHVHAVTRTTAGDTYAYDQSGHLVVSNDLLLSWGSDGMPERVENKTSGVAVELLYDASERRLIRTGSRGTTITFNELVERGPGGGLVSYYLLDGRRVARRDGARATFYTMDLQDNVRLVTDATGKDIARYDYAPFGAVIAASGAIPGDATLADGRSDEDLPLVDMGARFYDPRLARFISADTIVPDAFDSQALDRFAYVLNSPPNYSDPTGHVPDPVNDREFAEQANPSKWKIGDGLDPVTFARPKAPEANALTIGVRDHSLFDCEDVAEIAAMFGDMRASTLETAAMLLEPSAGRSPAIPIFAPSAGEIFDELYLTPSEDPCRAGPCLRGGDGLPESMDERKGYRDEFEDLRQFGANTTAPARTPDAQRATSDRALGQRPPARPVRWTRYWRPSIRRGVAQRVRDEARRKGPDGRPFGPPRCQACDRATVGGLRGALDHIDPLISRWIEINLMREGLEMPMSEFRSLWRDEANERLQWLCERCNSKKSDRDGFWPRGIRRYFE